jgi:hypothetical protein
VGRLGSFSVGHQSYPWRLGQGKNFLSHKESLQVVLTFVSFFMTSNKKWNLEGSDAFDKKLPGRSKIWKNTYFGYSGRHQVHMNFQPSPPPPSHMLQLLPRFLPLPKQELSVTLNLFLCLKNFLTNLFLSKDNFRK